MHNRYSDMKDVNIIETTDSYKVSHYRQYPPDTKRVYSFLESRGGKFPEVTFYGLQYILKKYLTGIVTDNYDLDEAVEDFAIHFGDDGICNRRGWEYILKTYGGRLPLEIRAVPEGMHVPTGNLLMTIENTDDNVPWLTNYAESLLSQVWYPNTVATQCLHMRRMILKYLEETGDPNLIDYVMNDFGLRGSTSLESAGIGGSAHLTSFKGTDNMQAIRLARKYYGERMAGNSVVAAEHSTITSWGKDHELEAYANMLKEFPRGTVAVVSDSYNIFRACKYMWGTKLRDQVLARDGVLVVRPDSGKPDEVVLKVLNLLGECFGTTINEKGYRLLNPKVRVIQGDGIDYEMVGLILETMKLNGWSADNIVFGSGGGLLQQVNRDTQKFAIKCSAVLVGDEWRDVMKDPITDPGKRSKAGRLALVKLDGQWMTMRQEEASLRGLQDHLVPVYRNGELLVGYTFDEIRARVQRD